jgi:hypothetical protein
MMAGMQILITRTDMQIIWTNLEILERYVTGDQWGPLVKLYSRDYEVHLHMNPHGTDVLQVGTVRNLGGGIRLNVNRYANDVPADRHPMANPPLPPTVHQARAMFLASGGVVTTYHQWLRTETTGATWTLNCGRNQEHRMRGNKPPYHA